MTKDVTISSLELECANDGKKSVRQFSGIDDFHWTYGIGVCSRDLGSCFESTSPDTIEGV